MEPDSTKPMGKVIRIDEGAIRGPWTSEFGAR